MAVLAGMVEIAAPWCLLALIVAKGVCLLRLLFGPTVADRVVALDVIAVLAAGAMAALALGEGEPTYVSVALVIALVAFLSTVALALYVEWRSGMGHDEEVEDGEEEPDER